MFEPSNEASNLIPNNSSYNSFVDVDETNNDTSQTSGSEENKTTMWQTFVHLLKGYLGAGCLSLPWALSQLGIFWGPLAVLAVAFWSSYNCWTIVKIKRYIEGKTSYVDDKASEVSSAATSITYADVGDWAYGGSFQSYVAVCVCTQQLAICTVFISFVGENLLAVLESLDISFMATHVGVMTIVLPLIMSLSLIPNLKRLAPVMTAGTILLIASFVAIGVIIQKEWPNRPDETPAINPPQIPLAICAILYSYEGINLILPVEAAMSRPKDFKKAFVSAMLLVALILSAFSAICLLTFGNVTSGSVTAFLLDEYQDDPTITFWLLVANTTVSLSVLLTYPLQLFPALELLGPTLSKLIPALGNATQGEDDEDDDDLSGFEPLPPLPEHGFPSLDSIPDMQHEYELDEEAETDDENTESSVAGSIVTIGISVFAEMTMPGDSPQLRLFLVFMTYLVAVVVPNVQALISLAGALAGSSSALLIPPTLELAWIRHVEEDPALSEDKERESRWTMFLPGTECFGMGKWWFEKLKCYVLLTLGFLFFGIGTFASIADIVKIYESGSG